MKTKRRLDLVASSKHDRYLREDYRRLRDVGIATVREGLRWHLIETAPGRYDFSSAAPVLEAARDFGIDVIWDLFHYGWPDGIDIFSPSFLERIAAFADAFVAFHKGFTDVPLWLCPVNEISFLSWGGGDKGFLNPFARKRGDELKVQLVRAALVATDAARSVDPSVRVMAIDPVIHVLYNPKLGRDPAEVSGYNQAQYAAWDMLVGKLQPGLGGAPSAVDVIGVNYYARNQWVDEEEEPVARSDPRYKPFRTMLKEVWDRYRLPLYVAETGVEFRARANWLRYMLDEVEAALDQGIPVTGVCWYPILDHPGWADNRHCCCGMWGYADQKGTRAPCKALVREVLRQKSRLEGLLVKAETVLALRGPGHRAPGAGRSIWGKY